MKNIKFYAPKKYVAPPYEEVAPGIYRKNNLFVTTLCFEQEPKLGEGKSATDISQYPLEDVLNHFNVHVSDFYPELNNTKSAVCYLEFAGSLQTNISELHSLIGHRVYNKTVYENGEECVILIIE